MTIYTDLTPPTEPVPGDIWVNAAGTALMWNGATWSPTTNPLVTPNMTPRRFIAHSYPRKDGNSYG